MSKFKVRITTKIFQNHSKALHEQELRSQNCERARYF